jgi:hypothetical protein
MNQSQADSGRLQKVATATSAAAAFMSAIAALTAAVKPAVRPPMPVQQHEGKHWKHARRSDDGNGKDSDPDPTCRCRIPSALWIRTPELGACGHSVLTGDEL